MKNILLAGVTAALFAGAAPAAFAQVTEPVTFTLHNESEHDLISLYISVPSTDEWEEDIFGDGILESGDSVDVTIDDDLEDCEYDLKAEFSDGSELVVGSENFCELDGGDVTVHDE
ncbi:hypothetical protein [Brevundimonas sp. NIBR11]|uniref:hypothetical protein n=1 Tax=Brevundimonas sp. NIBR11 TaxID=3015999 RepID=UPI0022F0ECE5|nr:hypothetical protein [Brevundimonas sp. NIBR11]WGM30785.1 hypothetical protein KKHFBJBL_01017 [Brevundimonas sp. NIBR11]